VYDQLRLRPVGLYFRNGYGVKSIRLPFHIPNDRILPHALYVQIFWRVVVVRRGQWILRANCRIGSGGGEERIFDKG
jgi:hypothetical protein